jgi:hypothetical protein
VLGAWFGWRTCLLEGRLDEAARLDIGGEVAGRRVVLLEEGDDEALRDAPVLERLHAVGRVHAVFGEEGEVLLEVDEDGEVALPEDGRRPGKVSTREEGPGMVSTREEGPGMVSNGRRDQGW